MRQHKFWTILSTTILLGAVTVGASGCGVTASGSSATDSITIVWYPNESAADFAPARDEIAQFVKQATGKKVTNMTTTDYTVAIQAISSGKAQLAYMGAQGYVQANEQNPTVLPLFTYSGPSGTLSDAMYYSMICVNTADASHYLSGGTYSIENIAGERMSFVSQSSTSGWAIPTSAIVGFFKSQSQWSNLKADDLAQGGSGKLFSTVLFGNSHQGSAVNLLTGKVDVAAFDDDDLTPYVHLASGTANTAGAVYEVINAASAPFDTLAGKEFTVIGAYPVLNEPFVYNSAALGEADAQKILTIMTSNTVSDDTLIFDPNGKGLLGKTENEHFVKVTDDWYQPIRDLGDE